MKLVLRSVDGADDDLAGHDYGCGAERQARQISRQRVAGGCRRESRGHEAKICIAEQVQVQRNRGFRTGLPEGVELTQVQPCHSMPERRGVGCPINQTRTGSRGFRAEDRLSRIPFGKCTGGMRDIVRHGPRRKERLGVRDDDRQGRGKQQSDRDPQPMGDDGCAPALHGDSGETNVHCSPAEMLRAPQDATTTRSLPSDPSRLIVSDDTTAEHLHYDGRNCQHRSTRHAPPPGPDACPLLDPTWRSRPLAGRPVASARKRAELRPDGVRCSQHPATGADARTSPGRRVAHAGRG